MEEQARPAFEGEQRAPSSFPEQQQRRHRSRFDDEPPSFLTNGDAPDQAYDRPRSVRSSVSHQRRRPAPSPWTMGIAPSTARQPRPQEGEEEGQGERHYHHVARATAHFRRRPAASASSSSSSRSKAEEEESSTDGGGLLRTMHWQEGEAGVESESADCTFAAFRAQIWKEVEAESRAEEERELARTRRSYASHLAR